MGNQRLVFGVGTALLWVSLYSDENTALTQRREACRISTARQE